MRVEWALHASVCVCVFAVVCGAGGGGISSNDSHPWCVVWFGKGMCALHQPRLGGCALYQPRMRVSIMLRERKSVGEREHLPQKKHQH